MINLKALIILPIIFAATACLDQASQTSSNSTEQAVKAAKENKIQLTLAHSWPDGLPIYSTSPHDFAKLVSEMSDNRITVKVDSRNVHNSAFGIFEFIKLGQYDIGHTASFYYGKQDPDTLFFTSMPFGMTTLEQYAWYFEGGGLELANEVYGRHGMEVMPAGNTGVQMGGWFRKEINGLEDLQGLKMRIPGYGGKVVSALGVLPTNIPPGELYQSLEIGLLDALEWVGPSLDLSMGFHKVAPYYYTGWHEPASELMFFFNEAKMNSLPKWASTILRTAAKISAFNMTNEAMHKSSINWDAMLKEYPNIKVKTFPDSVVKALVESNNNLLAKEYARSPMAKRIMDSQRTYLDKARKYTKISEQAYLNLNVK